MSHFGSASGPRFGRGRKHAVRIHWTGTEIAVVLGFLLMVVLIVMLGMYLGWWSLQEEEKASSSQARTSSVHRLSTVVDVVSGRASSSG